MEIKAVVFDLDGTLINSLPFYVEAYDMTYRRFGFNLTRQQIIDNFPVKLADQCKKLGIENKAEDFKNIYMKNIYDTFLEAKLFDGFETVMSHLKDKAVKRAIVSFAFREYVDFIVDNFRIRNDFDAILSFDDVKNAKPNPEGVLTTSKLMSVGPNQIIVVGDSASDIEMGRSAGAKTCLFYPRENREIYNGEKMMKIKSDYKIDRLSQLIDIL